MRAVIIREVEQLLDVSVDIVAEQENLVPIMRLENGQEVLAYNCHRYVPLGTKGEATYDDARRVWSFTPDV